MVNVVSAFWRKAELLAELLALRGVKAELLALLVLLKAERLALLVQKCLAPDMMAADLTLKAAEHLTLNHLTLTQAEQTMV